MSLNTSKLEERLKDLQEWKSNLISDHNQKNLVIDEEIEKIKQNITEMNELINKHKRSDENL